MKGMMKFVSLFIFFGLIQSCAGITHYSKHDGRNMKPMIKHHNHHWRNHNCCSQTDYYYYSHYSQPRYYREISLAPAGCVNQPTRYFYFAPRCGESNWVYRP